MKKKQTAVLGLIGTAVTVLTAKAYKKYKRAKKFREIQSDLELSKQHFKQCGIALGQLAMDESMDLEERKKKMAVYLKTIEYWQYSIDKLTAELEAE